MRHAQGRRLRGRVGPDPPGRRRQPSPPPPRGPPARPSVDGERGRGDVVVVDAVDERTDAAAQAAAARVGRPAHGAGRRTASTTATSSPPPRPARSACSGATRPPPTGWSTAILGAACGEGNGPLRPAGPAAGPGRRPAARFPRARGLTFNGLATREIEVLRLVADGCDTARDRRQARLLRAHRQERPPRRHHPAAAAQPLARRRLRAAPGPHLTPGALPDRQPSGARSAGRAQVLPGDPLHDHREHHDRRRERTSTDGGCAWGTAGSEVPWRRGARSPRCWRCAAARPCRSRHARSVGRDGVPRRERADRVRQRPRRPARHLRHGPRRVATRPG